MLKRRVNYAKVHQDLFIPGFGSIGTTLPPNSKTLDLQMWRDTDGDLYLDIKAGGRRTEVVVSSSNTVLMVLGEVLPESEVKVA